MVARLSIAKNEHGEPESPPEAIELRMWLANPQHMATFRQRLSDVSWLLRLLKHNVARRANHEDHVTEHFWEGRFDCKRLPCENVVDLSERQLASSVACRLSILPEGTTPYRSPAAGATHVARATIPFDLSGRGEPWWHNVLCNRMLAAPLSRRDI